MGPDPLGAGAGQVSNAQQGDQSTRCCTARHPKLPPPSHGSNGTCLSLHDLSHTSISSARLSLLPSPPNQQINGFWRGLAVLAAVIRQVLHAALQDERSVGDLPRRGAGTRPLPLTKMRAKPARAPGRQITV